MDSRNCQDAQPAAWETIAVDKRARRDAAIPAEWQLRAGLCPENQLNVTRVPAECGILSSRELEITETDAALLVQKLATRAYSSYEVRSGHDRASIFRNTF